MCGRFAVRGGTAFGMAGVSGTASFGHAQRRGVMARVCASASASASVGGDDLGVRRRLWGGHPPGLLKGFAHRSCAWAGGVAGGRSLVAGRRWPVRIRAIRFALPDALFVPVGGVGVGTDPGTVAVREAPVTVAAVTAGAEDVARDVHGVAGGVG